MRRLITSGGGNYMGDSAWRLISESVTSTFWQCEWRAMGRNAKIDGYFPFRRRSFSIQNREIIRRNGYFDLEVLSAQSDFGNILGVEKVSASKQDRW